MKKPALPAALAKRAAAQHALRVKRLAERGRVAIARIRERQADVAENMVDIGLALAELKADGVAEALGRVGFAEVCAEDLRMPLSTANALVAIATRVPRELVASLGADRARAVLELVDATPADDTPADVFEGTLTLPSGRAFDVGAATTKEIREAARAFRDARPEAAEAVDRLRRLGIDRLVILTGDRRSVAEKVAKQMHFSEFKAEVLPHEKLEMVDELKARGHRVAVIGDGVNDAPALAAGDISIAMGAAGSDVAINSASIALLNSNLNRIPFLVELSRRTISVIRQNMIVGIIFIVAFLGLAGAGYVSPIAAAALHIVSGLIVVFNSARLVRCGEEIEQAEAAKAVDAGRAG